MQARTHIHKHAHNLWWKRELMQVEIPFISLDENAAQFYKEKITQKRFSEKNSDDYRSLTQSMLNREACMESRRPTIENNIQSSSTYPLVNTYIHTMFATVGHSLLIFTDPTTLNISEKRKSTDLRVSILYVYVSINSGGWLGNTGIIKQKEEDIAELKQNSAGH